MDPNKNVSGHNLKNRGRKQKFGYARKYAIWRCNFYFSPVAYRHRRPAAVLPAKVAKRIGWAYKRGCSLEDSMEPYFR